MWQWFLANGDKVLAGLTAVSSVVANMSDLFDPGIIKWVTFASALATVIHNTLLPEPTKTS
jgi:hypothetical protein